MSEWAQTVQREYRAGKARNPAFSLRDAMMSAKKVYKSSNKMATSVANQVTAPLKRNNKSRGKRSNYRRKTAKRS
jgi:hypothetical protein